MSAELHQLPPMAAAVVDRAIDNLNRKLVAGYRNKNNSRPNAKSRDPISTAGDAFDAASSASAMAVANRGLAWREMISKSLSHGISSIGTMKFDGEFTVKDGIADGLDQVPKSPGVYVVFDAKGQAIYVGDSSKLKSRWHAGHLNEHRQAKRAGEDYKLSQQFEEGCVVRYVMMDSVETAAAVEAHLIKTEGPACNAREELLTEQGKRSNIEAKKIKDSSGSVASLAKGAAVEAAANSGWIALEQLSSELIKALKDELVDLLGGGVAKLVERVRRVLARVWKVIAQIIEAPLKLLNGIVEFVVNALSKAIREVYALARNAFDIVQASWQLYKGSQTMSREDLIAKISETVIISGSLLLWDAFDPVIESQLLPLCGPVAPYLSATMSAIGFGLSSHYLRSFVPGLVAYLIDFKSPYRESLEAQREACVQLLVVSKREMESVLVLAQYVESTKFLIEEGVQHISILSNHKAVQRFDLRELLRSNPDNQNE